MESLTQNHILKVESYICVYTYNYTIAHSDVQCTVITLHIAIIEPDVFTIHPSYQISQ